MILIFEATRAHHFSQKQVSFRLIDKRATFCIHRIRHVTFSNCRRSRIHQNHKSFSGQRSNLFSSQLELRIIDWKFLHDFSLHFLPRHELQSRILPLSTLLDCQSLLHTENEISFCLAFVSELQNITFIAFQFTAHWMSVGKSENKMMQWNFFRFLVALDYSL